ncbi:MAG: hypothetical protein CMJ89_11660 [Planctomycetes bacterium]|jgi:hypothetical protein|nr:hypothetical protein [Planctomycetota bacterium]
MKGPIEAQKVALNWLNRAALAWFAVYLWKQGQDGFFARTVDRVDADWVKFVFLNIPLQIVLTFAAASCARSKRAGVVRIGLGAGALNVVLILGHIAFSVSTA